MSYYNYHRRTSIDKFNNRPPFDIKKMDDATSTENKEQTFCNNCEKSHLSTAAKSYVNVAKYLDQMNDKYQNYMNNKNNNVIPKIIESFQKVAPKKDHKRIKSKKKSESLQTLFRSNQQTFGKMLPNHRLMKDLLKKFDDEIAIETVPYQQIDMVPSKDISTNLSESTYKSNCMPRVDKGTSTTELQWPIVVNEEENCRVCLVHSKCHVAHNNFQKLKSKIPQRKELHMNNSCKFRRSNVDGKRSSGSSDLEYFPTKENPLRKSTLTSKIPLQIFKTENNFNKMTVEKEFPNFKYNTSHENIKKENNCILRTIESRKSDGKVEIRKKEKSFVQLQVEKFNKRNNVKDSHYRGRLSNNNLKTAELQDKKKNMNKHYISLMNSMKNTLPKMEGTISSESENHEWADNTIQIDSQVRFPKETCNAMEHLMKNLKRVPLTQYAKCQNFEIRPAIPVNCQAEHKQCNTTYSGMCHKKLSSSPPRSRNLCQKGSYDGACTRPEKIPPPRYANNNRLRANAKGLIK